MYPQSIPSRTGIGADEAAVVAVVADALLTELLAELTEVEDGPEAQPAAKARVASATRAAQLLNKTEKGA
jgi:hypothetical protein